MQAVKMTDDQEPTLDVAADFPGLKQKIHGKSLVYLDNAATTQKPQQVLDAMVHAYTYDCANIHRGVHLLSQRATDAYEKARFKVQKFIDAEFQEEIVFVRGATEGINLVAASYGEKFVHEGDEIIVSTMEHHSNIVPWQLLCGRKKARLRVIPIHDNGELDLDAYEKLLAPKTKMVAVAHVSNALGTINSIRDMITLAHKHNIPVLIDGAQAVQHQIVSVRGLDCDFYAFSGHKMYGPTGVGVLYGKKAWLTQMPPYQGGGDMIASVTFEKTTYNQLPHKFEAGTPDIVGVIGLGAAIDYILSVGLERIARHERTVLEYGTRCLNKIKGLKHIGTSKHKTSVLSFVLDSIHPHDIGSVLDRQGIAIRAGHHCAQPLMERFGLAGTARASLGMYTTIHDMDALAAGLERVVNLFTPS